MAETAARSGADDSVARLGLDGERRRVERRIYLFGTISLLLTTPLNYLCVAMSWNVAYGSRMNVPGQNSFPPLPIALPFSAGCYATVIGLASLIIPHWLPDSGNGARTRRWLRAVAMTGAGSIIVAVLGIFLAMGPTR